MFSPWSRRRGLLSAGVVGVVGAVLTLSACASAEPAPPGGGAVTVATAFGDVSVPSAPKRVVALGWGDAEVALTLGVQPVGAADWLPVGGDGVATWVPRDRRYTTEPKLLGTKEVDVEQVAALEPDLILDTRASGDRARYDQLAALGVPVVGIPRGGEAYRTTWQDQLTLIGRALGKPAEAAKVRADLEAKFQRAAAANPGFAGRTMVTGARTGAGYGAYVNGGSRVEFMEKLGFQQSPKVQALAGKSFSVPVSAERMDLFDADLTVISLIGATADQVTGDPLFQSVPSVKAGHFVVLTDRTISQAFASGTPLGLSYAIDRVVPLLAQARAR
ncbi:iron-siderophore ABC transporter substrate-binding protein [Amycolatopsis sp. PS_44_ISF1]|uniref:iron-siderophore ABC transporter substrate-binding protein n=1 Tax=Amycolatopsis sp. PS_44_ISF1 TaxID=2974917 RepID=UPI0028E04F26|nr:iron-siderophore ABC transporter substrate-binding protein [Amycolatopsis sp. PS_44_ISF1]MDT8913058.1 iron-siderophore ABC transporter substrate-binding protein [Amycolatopsis sp. PS_44_ISF1]